MQTINQTQVLNVASIIGKEILGTLYDMGDNIQGAQPKIQAFITMIQPDIDKAIKAKDLLSLSYLRDRCAMQLAYTSLELNDIQRAAVTNTVITVLRVLIVLGISAV